FRSFFFSSRRRHTRFSRDWSSDVCSSDLAADMEVVTTSPELEALRKTLLEMVVSENPRLEVDPLRSFSSQELSLLAQHYAVTPRSEERRVGKECGSRRWPSPDRGTGTDGD